MADTPGLEIINLALRHIAQKKVTQTELNNNSTRQTVAILDVWDFALEETLRSYDWGFARVEEALTEDEDFEPVNFEYAYARPENCLAIRRVFNASTSEKTISEPYMEVYDPDGDVTKIVTDVDDAYIRYTYLVTNTALYDAFFKTAFSHRLAAEVAVPLNGDKEMAKAQIAIFNGLISEAKRHSNYERNEAHEANEKSNIVDARG